MKMTKKLLLIASALCVLLFVSGCDYVPRQVFEIETKDGQTIKLACPVIDPGRSTFTYLIDGYCTVYN